MISRFFLLGVGLARFLAVALLLARALVFGFGFATFAFKVDAERFDTAALFFAVALDLAVLFFLSTFFAGGRFARAATVDFLVAVDFFFAPARERFLVDALEVEEEVFPAMCA